MNNDSATAILFLRSVTSAKANVGMAVGRFWPDTPTKARSFQEKSIATIVLGVWLRAK